MQITLETLRNEESRDALIDDLIRMMVDGHIVTVLNFIPVEERLPTDDESECVLEIINRGSREVLKRTYAMYIDGQWVDPWDDGPVTFTDVTHWAEIPEIE